MRYLFGVFLLVALGAARASTVTIDFEEFSIGASGPLVSQGYEISAFNSSADVGNVALSSVNSSNSFSIFGLPEFFFIGDPVNRIASDASVLVKRADGGAFSLWSADIFQDIDFYTGSTFIWGKLANGDSIFTYYSSDLGQGAWLNVTSVLIGVASDGDLADSGYLEVDDIVVGAAVPIPAAVWLFASGLGMLGWIRRKS